MSNPLRSLKYLPWIPLLQAALLTTLIAIAIDFLIALSFLAPPLRVVAVQILNSPLEIFVRLASAVGLGALAVVVITRWFRQLVITNALLWALVPCLVLCLFLKSLLGLPAPLLPAPNYPVLIGIILGIFWKGRRY
ncbi:peptide chain release factor 1 [Myxacorys almedinensis]|uniref:Peptide chain release factor 1 n=1 Tax=Myxacorys almedinensis A TaxID=2690445 RepID=A0A8J7ZAX4_9CYAN|nr:peptide chain release factor 1 [Myxacorys almedinensis]NDJ18630.1 peptide chain release factor 1 [Myxacorys almedinensis A]